MTKQECAIITAYTDFSMLRGNDLKYLYRYLSEIIGRPVFSHEIPAVCEQFRYRIKADFIALCCNASDDIARDDESATALAKMPERPIDGNRLAELFETAAERGAGVLATVYRDAAHFARTAPTISQEDQREATT